MKFRERLAAPPFQIDDKRPKKERRGTLGMVAAFVAGQGILGANCAAGRHLVRLDGKQRLTAVQAFLAGKIPAFGHYIGDWEGHLRGVVYYFEFQVIDCPSREDRLRLYLQHNGGGVVHSKAELDRVRALLAAEKAK